MSITSSNSKALYIVAFALTLGAGVVGGMVISRHTRTQTITESTSASLDELQLTDAQTKEMRQIWETVRESAQLCQTRGQQLRQQRDRQLEAMLSEEQKSRFEPVNRAYEAQVLSLNTEREAAFQRAIDQTDKMLNESQKEKYHRILRSKTGRDAGRLPLSPAGATGSNSSSSQANMISP